jgi:hypothetical protein
MITKFKKNISGYYNTNIRYSKTQLLNIKQKTEDIDVNINIANKIVNMIRIYNIQRNT